MTEAALYTDKSIVSMSGVSQVAAVANPKRRALIVHNSGNATAGVNILGGTAVIGGAGTIAFPALSVGIVPFQFDVVPQAAINVIGAAGQPINIFEA